MKKLEKVRKLLFGLLGLAALGGGLWFAAGRLPIAPPGDVGVAAVASAVTTLYQHFSDGVWLIVGAVMLGNFGEHWAARGKKTDPGSQP